MLRVVLILPSATYRAPEFLDAAATLGVEVVTASDTEQALAASMGDRFLRIDLDDPDQAASAICALNERRRIDAVVGVDDLGLLSAAVASNRLGLRSNPPDAVAATRNKVEMRARLARADVEQPAYRVVARGGDLAARISAAAAEIGYPCVIKPPNLSGSRGVIRADDDHSAHAAVARIEAILEREGDLDSPLLLEAFVPGEEIAVEGLLSDGRLSVLAVFDKPDPLDGPYFEETIYLTPSRKDPALLEGAADLVERACAAIGLSEGPVHAEVRLRRVGPDEAQPVLIEVAARTIGGRCATVLSFTTGETLETLVLAHALGIERALPTQSSGASGVMMLPIERSGRLVSVGGREQTLAVDGIVGLEISVAPGRHIEALPEASRYLGFLFAAGPDPAFVEDALRRAHAALSIDIEAVETDRANGADLDQHHRIEVG